MTGKYKFLSDRQLRLRGRWTPDEAFSDIPGMQLKAPLSQGVYEAAMTTRRKPRSDHGAAAFINVERLAFRVIYLGGEPQPVIPMSAGSAWLALVCPDLSSEMAHGLMLAACWRTACRVARGSRDRTNIAKIAFKAYAAAYPTDPRVARQPLAGAAA
jgi:hypothetical protein